MTACPLGLAGLCYCGNKVSSFGSAKSSAKTAVLLLAHGSPDNPDQVPDIEELVKLAQPTISHHMRILEKACLVEAKREGHWRWYRRNEKLIAEMMRGLKGQL